MERRSTYGYIFIGTAVRYLLDSSEGMLIFADGALDENITELRSRLEQYEFLVTWRLSASLVEVQKVWKSERDAADDPESWAKDRVLSADEQKKLQSAAHMVRETMLAEAAGKLAYIATDKRHTVEVLVDNVGKLMGAGVFAKLPDIAQKDFEEAGRAIAFDLPTAGAFHILRGTEAVLRDFYARVVKRNRIAEPRMWSPMLTDLRSKSTPPPALLLDNLDSLRKHFRNPTQHPEKTYDNDEVQDLLALAVDSINRMIKYLDEKGL